MEYPARVGLIKSSTANGNQISLRSLACSIRCDLAMSRRPLGIPPSSYGALLNCAHHDELLGHVLFPFVVIPGYLDLHPASVIADPIHSWTANLRGPG
jgi:hypothetical protein